MSGYSGKIFLYQKVFSKIRVAKSMNRANANGMHVSLTSPSVFRTGATTSTGPIEGNTKGASVSECFFRTCTRGARGARDMRGVRGVSDVKDGVSYCSVSMSHFCVMVPSHFCV